MSVPNAPPLPGETETVTAASALVVAPHFDDEVLGCGGLVAQLTARGAVVRVLFLSDGGGGVEDVADRVAYASRRRAEARAALAVLGVAGCEMLDLPDGGLEAHRAAIAAALRRALVGFRPRLLLAPSPGEITADHRAAFSAVYDALAPVRRGDELAEIVADLEVLLYEVNHPGQPNLLVDVSAEVEVLRRAMACYASQEERHPYLNAALGLRAYRALSLSPGVRAAEAYRRLTARDFQVTGRWALESELRSGGAVPRGAAGPLVSVVVRTKDRPALVADALRSLAASTHRELEVVLVNDGGAPVDVPADFPHRLVRVELRPGRGRAGAANAGIERAGGAFVAFLDDDDLVEPDHYEVLTGLVRGSDVRIAYTDAAVGLWELTPGGWTRRERRLPYSRDFDGDLLQVDNYIPLHTLLIDRGLARSAGPLDESLPFFEDWDWLIRLSELAPFHHHRRVTCEYRHFRGAAHHVLGDAPRERQDFLTMKARVLEKNAARLSPARLARIVDVLRREAVEGIEEAARVRQGASADRRAREQAELEYHRMRGEAQAARGHVDLLVAENARLGEEGLALRREIEGRDADLRRLYDTEQALRRELERRDADLGRLYADERALRGTVEEQTSHIGRLYAEIERLQRVVAAMQATRAWRTHLWWQRRRGGGGGASG
jgi:LmbE family N-acetylglucosaminyl deacetylase